MPFYRLSGFFDAIAQVAKFSTRWDDDFIDRLNHRFSSIMLVCMTIVVSYKQYVGEPIVCWCPGTWTGAMIDYAHQICWISNTYYLPAGVAPLTKNQPREQVLIYYQWIPFILLAQTLLFQLPNIIWKIASGIVGLDLNRLARTVSGIENVNPEVRDRTVRTLVKQMDRSLSISSWRTSGPCATCVKRAHRHVCLVACGRGFGNYLTTLYLICKICYVGNSIGQLFMLNYLLGAERFGLHYFDYGIQIFSQLARGQDVEIATRVFPRVTMCDFTIRQMANFQDITIECTLPINLFNEKIFIIIWLWLMIMSFFNLMSLFFWLSSIFAVSRIGYVKKYLYITAKMRRRDLDMRHINCFTDMYLRYDGVFAIKMLARNTNDVIVSEIVCKLWDHYILHHAGHPEFHYKHGPIREAEPIEMEMAESRRPNNLEFDELGKTPTTPGNLFPV